MPAHSFRPGRRGWACFPGGARLFLLAALVFSSLVTGTPSAAKDDSGKMRFMVARLAIGCEPVCPEWISAEGEIAADSAKTFRTFLKGLGKKRLPVLLHSVGGDVDAALAIGEMIREQGLDIAIARTAFSDCVTDMYCRPAGREVYLAMPHLAAMCTSACPFILASGVHRLAISPAEVGVHQITTTYSMQRVTYKTLYRIVNGRKKIIGEKVIKRSKLPDTTSTNLGKKTRKRLLRYFKQMGVDGPELIEAMLLASPQDMNMLDGDRLLQLRLVTREGSAANLVGSSVCAKDSQARNCIRVGGFPATPQGVALRAGQ